MAQLNVEIPEELKRAIKSTAAIDGVSLQNWTIAALRDASTPYKTANSASPYADANEAKALDHAAEQVSGLPPKHATAVPSDQRPSPASTGRANPVRRILSPRKAPK